MELNVLRAVESEHSSLLANHRFLKPRRVDGDGEGEEGAADSSGGDEPIDERQLLCRHSMRHEMMTAEGATVVLQTTRFRKHYRSMLQCISRNFGKGFVLGGGANAALGLVGWLLALAKGSGKNKKGASEGLLARAFGGDTLTTGVFGGSLLSLYNLGMYVTRFEGGLLHTYRGAVAGVLAGGLASRALSPGMRNTLALFFFVRGAELQARIAAGRGLVPNVPHADTALMSLVSAQAMWAWMFRWESIDPGYLRFLNHHGQKELPVLHCINAQQRGLPFALDAVNAVRAAGQARLGLFGATRKLPPVVFDAAGAAAAAAAAGGAAMAHAHDHSALCRIIHPGTESCTRHVLEYFVRGWRLAVPVYLPVYLLPMLLFGSKRLLRDPRGSAWHLVTGVATSSTFLSLYTTIGFASICGLRSVCHPASVGTTASHVSLGALGGMLCGLANLAERKSRRIELALFVMSHALRSLWYVLRTDKVLPPWLVRWLLRNDRGASLMMAWGFGVVMHAFVRHPAMLRSSYFGLCVRLFDSEDHRHALFGKSEYVQTPRGAGQGGGGGGDGGTATQTSPRRAVPAAPPLGSKVAPPRLVLPNQKKTQSQPQQGLASVDEAGGD
jgi:hypothetical protein